MRRLAVILVLVLVFSMVACQAPVTPAEDTAPAIAAADPTAAPAESTALALEGVTLTYIIDRDTDQTASKAVMEAFSALTGVKFEEELRPGGAEGETILKTRFATGDAPDFIWFNGGSLLNTLDPEKNLIDISGQPYMSKLPDSYKQTVNGGVEGKVFGIPGRTSMGGGWLYNKKVAAELGLNVPTSWSELIENCKVAKAAGKTAIIGSYADSWTAQLILLADYGNVAAVEPNFAADFNANKTKFATSPAALRSFEKLAEVRDYLNEDYLATTNDLAYELLANGEGLYYPMLTFGLDNIANTYPDKIDDIGFFAQPADDAANTTLTVWMPDGWYACAGTENFDAVNAFFEFVLSEEGQSILASVSAGNGPSVVAGAPMSDKAYAAVKEIQQYFDSGKTAPALEFITAVKGPNLPQICVECGSGVKSPADCAAEYDKDVEKQAQQLGLAGW